MLVTVFIFAIMVGIVFELYLLYVQNFYFYDARAQLVQSASSMAKAVTQNTELANDIEPTWAVTWNNTTYTSNASTLVLKVASIDASGNPIANQYDHIIFASNPTDATQLMEITDANTAGGSKRTNIQKQIGNQIKEYIFTYKNADPDTSTDVAFTVTTQKKLERTTAIHTLQTYAKLRNK